MTDEFSPNNTPKLTRRTLIKTAAATGATTALLQAVRMAFPGGAFAAPAAPETTKAVLGYIALTDASPLIIAKEKGFFRQARRSGCRGQQAGVVGHHPRQSRAGCGEQRHRRRAHPHAAALSDEHGQGDAEQRAGADVSARAAQLRLPGDLAFERVQGSQGRARRLALESRVRKEESDRQGGQRRDDVPRRNARHVDPLLARGRRHRSRQGCVRHRRAAAADGGEHEGRQHGRLLRGRAVERAARAPEHRLHGADHRRALGEPSGEVARACAPPMSTNIPTQRARS